MDINRSYTEFAAVALYTLFFIFSKKTIYTEICIWHAIYALFMEEIIK